MRKFSYIGKIGYKKDVVYPINRKVLFLVGDNTSRKELVEFLKEFDEDLDLRTMSLVETLADTECSLPQILDNVVEDRE